MQYNTRSRARRRENRIDLVNVAVPVPPPPARGSSTSNGTTHEEYQRTVARNDVDNALALSSIIVLKALLRGISGIVRVLVIGSGLRSIGTVTKHAVDPSQLRFTCLEGNPAYAVEIRNRYPHADVIEGSIDDDYVKIREAGRYDIIAVFMGLNHIVGGTNGPANFFSNVLTERGVLLGSFFDHNCYLSNSTVVNETVSGIEVSNVVTTDARFALGTRMTTIGDITGLSPLVTSARMDDFSEHHGLECQMYRGGAVFSCFDFLTHEINRDYPLRNTAIPSLACVCVFRRIVDEVRIAGCLHRGLDQLPLPGTRYAVGDAIQRFFGFRPAGTDVSLETCMLVIDYRGLCRGDEVLYSACPQFGRPIYLQCVPSEDLQGNRYEVLGLLEATFRIPNLTFHFRHRFLVKLMTIVRESGCELLSYNEYTWFQWVGRGDLELIPLFGDEARRAPDDYLPLIRMTPNRPALVPVSFSVLMEHAPVLTVDRRNERSARQAPRAVIPGNRLDHPTKIPAIWVKRTQPAVLSTHACVVCLDKERNVVLTPCRHLCSCAICSSKLTECPICKRRINEFYPIFNV